ncbi:MAG TPA: hypothetical protein VHJ78_11590 [Actinomycetota bacterium]|nr:hypothetical protein [Actinomycetota bacterium]
MANLDLDRIPDPEGAMRVLVDRDQVAQLMENGFEVHLVRALPVRPLDPSLVVDDKASSAWLEERLKGIERRGTQ